MRALIRAGVMVSDKTTNYLNTEITSPIHISRARARIHPQPLSAAPLAIRLTFDPHTGTAHIEEEVYAVSADCVSPAGQDVLVQEEQILGRHHRLLGHLHAYVDGGVARQSGRGLDAGVVQR